MASPNSRLSANSTNTTVNVLASAAYTSTQTSEWYQVGTYAELVLSVDVTAISGTSPTLDVYLQTKLPDEVNPCDLAAMTQITSGTPRRVLNFSSGGNSEYLVTDGTMTAGTIKTASIGGYVRVKAVIGGTNPSFTMSIDLGART